MLFGKTEQGSAMSTQARNAWLSSVNVKMCNLIARMILRSLLYVMFPVSYVLCPCSKDDVIELKATL